MTNLAKTSHISTYMKITCEAYLYHVTAARGGKRPPSNKHPRQPHKADRKQEIYANSNHPPPFDSSPTTAQNGKSTTLNPGARKKLLSGELPIHEAEGQKKGKLKGKRDVQVLSASRVNICRTLVKARDEGARWVSVARAEVIFQGV